MKKNNTDVFFLKYNNILKENGWNILGKNKYLPVISASTDIGYKECFSKTYRFHNIWAQLHKYTYIAFAICSPQVSSSIIINIDKMIIILLN